jgi:hypothetical protein
MGWSIAYRPLKNPLLLNAFLLSVGKALYLATMFEAKCRYILRLGRIVVSYEKTGDASAAPELAKTLKDEMLGRTLWNLGGLGKIGKGDITILEMAKDARNYIAHECAGIGDLYEIRANDIEERLERLQREVVVLANGDNMVSRWIYEIEEKEPAPRLIQDKYADYCVRWVFGDHESER